MTPHVADERECIEEMFRSELPKNPVAYMTTVEKSLGRSMTVMEAGEIYGAWQRAVPMEEIAATIRTRDNAVGAGAANVNNADPAQGLSTLAPRPSSTVSRSTLAAIDYARANDMLTEKAESAPVESICVVCCGAGGMDSEESWPTAPAWEACRACGGSGVKP